MISYVNDSTQKCLDVGLRRVRTPRRVRVRAAVRAQHLLHGPLEILLVLEVRRVSTLR